MDLTRYNQMQKVLDEKIKLLGNIFLENPLNYFQEKQIHSVFYQLCHKEFGEALKEGTLINLFRQEYNSIWRYSRKDKPPFSNRYEGKQKSKFGKRTFPASFDFCILNREFVKNHDLLTIINKDEVRRSKLRSKNLNYPIIDIGIEFKMIHLRNKYTISTGDINAFKKGQFEDCRKLALEGIPITYLLGFSNISMPQEINIQNQKNKCKEEFKKYKTNKISQLRVSFHFPKKNIKK